MTMAKHEDTAVVEKTLAITRPWQKIDPKVIVGAVSSITVTGVVTAFASVGINLPVWAAGLIIVAAYFAASYATKTRIPVANDSGLSEQYAAAAAAASESGDELADGDVSGALGDAFHAAGYTLDDDGNVIDGPDDGPAVRPALPPTSNPPQSA